MKKKGKNLSFFLAIYLIIWTNEVEGINKQYELTWAEWLLYFNYNSVMWLSQRKGKSEFKLLILSVYSVMLLHSNTIFFSMLLTVLIALLSYM